MKFGLFYETFVSDDDLANEPEIVRQTVEQIVHADRHGWDTVWMAEHHFLRGFSHSSAPDLIFAAAAPQTERIRFGFGLALTAPAYNHPVRIAERVATLDCLSNGRVDLGSGRSTTPTELYGFNIDPESARAQWEEGIDAVVRLLAEEDVVLEGDFARMPRRTVYPRPVQKPHPPLWVGGVGPGNAERAAAKGLGMLFFAHQTDVEMLKASTEAYKANIGKARTRYGLVNDQIAGFINGLCGPASQRDALRKLAAEKTVEHTYHGARYMLEGWPEEKPPQSYAHLDSGDTRMMFEAIRDNPSSLADFFLQSGFVMAGSPDDCMEIARSFQDAGVDQLIVHMQMGGIDHRLIMDSIALFGNEVIPAFR